jgi:tetratricopeptide (TPR) repeat protein
MARMQHAPAAIRTLEPAIPEALERIVSRCIDPDPEKRYQTIAELSQDLGQLDADGRGPTVDVAGAAPPRRAWPKPARIAVGGAVALLALAPAVALIAVLTGRWGGPAPPPDSPREPLSMLIADFDNQAGDPLFDGSLEQVLAIAMEGAPFITTFPRRDALISARQAQAIKNDKLDEAAARLVSGREGLKVVLAGVVARDGDGYRVDVRAVDPRPGTTLATASKTARAKQDVLKAVADVASDIRKSLGDVTSESQRLSDAETFTAASLEAAREYGLAQQLSSNGKYQESIEHFKRATEADPRFGRAYAAWAVSAFTLGRSEEAEKLYQTAFTMLDRMTKREEYRTLGTYYLSVARNYGKAVENYSALVSAYPADRGGHSNLALSYFYLLNFPKALEHGRRATEIYGTSPKFRSNYALYAMYAGDFATAAREAGDLIKAYPDYYRGYLPIAMSAVAGNQPDAARQAYQTMSKAGGAQGASLAEMGLADLAMYAGQYDEAIDILRPAIDRDQKINNKLAQAGKLVALSEALLVRGKSADAIGAAQQAAGLSRDPSILVPAARVFLKAGRAADAAAMAADLGKRLQPSAQAYGRLLDADIALAQGRAAQAMTALADAQRLSDSWLTRLARGIANVEAGQYPEAKSDLELCLQRRGEATAVFLEDVPSIRYLAPVHYWLGRALEGLGVKEQAASSYKSYLALRSPAGPDPLAADAARRTGQLVK